MIKGCLLHHPLDPNRTPWKMLEPVQDPFSFLEELIWVVVSIIFYFHPYLRKIPILTNIFQRGWNHQLVINLHRKLRVRVFNGQIYRSVNPKRFTPVANVASLGREMFHCMVVWFVYILLVDFYGVNGGKHIKIYYLSIWVLIFLEECQR